MSHRLFAAIRPPAAVRHALLSMMVGVEGARWQSDDQLHLTLRFIGEVDGDVAEDIAAVLDGVHHAPIEIAIASLGTFDKRGRIVTLWAGVQLNDALEGLHRKVDRALVLAGLEPERRAFKPHITLARFSRRGGDGGAFLTTHPGLALPPWTATNFALFESHLGREGPRYTEVTRYQLRG